MSNIIREKTWSARGEKIEKNIKLQKLLKKRQKITKKKMPKGTLIVRPKSAQLTHDTETFGKMVMGYFDFELLFKNIHFKISAWNIRILL